MIETVAARVVHYVPGSDGRPWYGMYQPAPSGVIQYVPPVSEGLGTECTGGSAEWWYTMYQGHGCAGGPQCTGPSGGPWYIPYQGGEFDWYIPYHGADKPSVTDPGTLRTTPDTEGELWPSSRC